MRRPQFSIRTLLWLTLVVAIGFTIGPPLMRNYAPKWGNPRWRWIGDAEIEMRWPSGRVESSRVGLSRWPDRTLEAMRQYKNKSAAQE